MVKIEKNILNSVHIMSSAGRIRCAISNVHRGLLVIISTCIRHLEKANRISYIVRGIAQSMDFIKINDFSRNIS